VGLAPTFVAIHPSAWGMIGNMAVKGGVVMIMAMMVVVFTLISLCHLSAWVPLVPWGQHSQL